MSDIDVCEYCGGYGDEDQPCPVCGKQTWRPGMTASNQPQLKHMEEAGDE